jgi:predicted RNA-binding Zn-ribbon protein involved in translation (DUF1610 family)
MYQCHHCKQELDIPRKVGRTEPCPHCGADLHVCLNCRFYDPAAYNQCHEPQAERVVDKDRSNFCEYFIFGDAAPHGGPDDRKKDATRTLEALFKK